MRRAALLAGLFLAALSLRPQLVGTGPLLPAVQRDLGVSMLGAGYTLSSSAPLVLGAARDATGSFTTSLWVLVGLGAALVVLDASLTRARLGAGRPSGERPLEAASG